ncbi:hypothetical protein EDC65_2055 [Stella humosa]|uniref:ATP-grasp domain-containing protein n=1 Tax=Stella humosa TaxID=94 RepID=A0A3N1MAG6_9PROT|nr:hypothetical protein [Stella humosa]ROQ00259.1 hypothetical protein EDC65_2055 [Stella humosa]BBK30503.1 hypothetical protein STHU_11370 [Stella humosa]
MIVYLSTSNHGYTVGKYLAGPGAHLAGRLVHRTYVEVLTGGAALSGLVPATWIFSDIERLLPALVPDVLALWRHLGTRGCRLLNHPTLALRRYELLRLLHHRGINDFDVYRVTDRRRPRRYPVFLRRDNNHSGPLSILLEDAAALDRAVEGLRGRGWPLQSVIIVEFSDTGDEAGVYRKYGAFRVGPAIVPAHVDASRDWSVKDDVLDMAGDREREFHFIEHNPWEAPIRRAFELARIDYGRIDFSLRGDGSIVVWEINTNPLIAFSEEDEASRALAARFMPCMTQAIEALDR